MSVAGEYRRGDEHYDTLYDRWTASGCPDRFEIINNYGGSRYKVLGKNESYPRFYLVVGAGPTSSGYNEDTEEFKPADWEGPREGYEYETRDTGLEIREASNTDDFTISMVAPPKDYEAAEDILEGEEE